jgi:translation initiation factor eIF-2B subunit beta
MPSTISGQAPSLSTFLKTLKSKDIESSIELFVSLLQRRQIRNSRPCALATTQLLLRIVAAERTRDAQALITRIRDVGRRLVAAQPREMAVGNIVRRVLGVIREVVEADQDQSATSETSVTSPTLPSQQSNKSRPGISSTISSFSPLHHGGALPHDMLPRPMSSGDTTPFALTRSGTDTPNSHLPAGVTSPPISGQGPAPATSLFGLFDLAQGVSPAGTPPTGAQSPVSKSASRKDTLADSSKLDVKAEVIDGIKELLDELEVVDSQIAESALDHIHSNEIIMTHTSSQTVQKFLAAAARKRKFTLVHAEAFPNDHLASHATIVNGGRKSDSENPSDDDERWKPLTAMGITVILIPDSAVFALMSRINKVILAPHTVLANGSLIAAAGSATIARAARAHRVPVVVLSGVYKLSPVYPFDSDELIESGDPGKVVPYCDGEFMAGVDVVNPVFDHVEADLVDLYITNLGAHAPSYLYRIVADHYRVEDVDLQA